MLLLLIAMLIMLVGTVVGDLGLLDTLVSLTHDGALSVLAVEALVGTHLAVVGGATVEVDATRELDVSLVGTLGLGTTTSLGLSVGDATAVSGSGVLLLLVTGDWGLLLFLLHLLLLTALLVADEFALSTLAVVAVESGLGACGLLAAGECCETMAVLAKVVVVVVVFISEGRGDCHESQESEEFHGGLVICLWMTI